MQAVERSNRLEQSRLLRNYWRLALFLSIIVTVAFLTLTAGSFIAQDWPVLKIDRLLVLLDKAFVPLIALSILFILTSRATMPKSSAFRARFRGAGRRCRWLIGVQFILAAVCLLGGSFGPVQSRDGQWETRQQPIEEAQARTYIFRNVRFDSLIIAAVTLSATYQAWRLLQASRLPEDEPICGCVARKSRVD